MSNLVLVCRLKDIFHIAGVAQWVAVLRICNKTSYVILIVLEHSSLRLLCMAMYINLRKGLIQSVKS